MGKIELDHTGSGSGVTLSSDGTDLLLDGTAIGGGGGAALDLYAENYDGTSTKPSATGSNGIALGRLAVASGNRSIAVGGGATATGLFSTALTNSYASGGDAFAAAISTGSSSYGATGTGAIAIGNLTKATASNSTSIGYFNQSTALGSVSLGYDVRVTGEVSAAMGYNSRNSIDGSFKFAGGKHSVDGDAQAGLYPLMAETTDATQTTMVTYHNNKSTASNDNQIIANADTAVSFIGTVVGKQSGSANVAAWKIEGVLVNNGGTTTLVNSAITVLDNTPSWALALSADDTNDALSVKVTGAAATSIRWLANIQTAEVKYA